MDLRCAQGVPLSAGVDEAGRFEFKEGSAEPGCSLDVSAPGYRVATLAASALPADPRIPAIVMYRLGKGQGESVSVSHLAAPAAAVGKYHLAVREMRRGAAGNPESVLEHLQSAVQAYPDYAQAWFEIGRLRLAKGSATAAIRAFREALRADPWFVSPYEPLILLLEATGDSAGARRACQGLLRINPALPADCRKG